MATTTYADTSLRELRAPAHDAAELRELLADPQVGGFTVTSVIDGTAQQVRLAVEGFLLGRSPEDLLLVYLSCHGLVDLRRRLYFTATDTFKNRLAATGVESQWLLDQLDDCRARRQVVILDCCFSGAFAGGVKGDTDLRLGERFHGQGRGRVVLTASRASEYSFEGEPVPDSAVPGSVFTRALVAGLRTGEADTDNDGYISVDDVYTYAFDRVRASDAQQTPQRWLYGAEGNILLARSIAGITVTPAALPEVLRAGLDSPHPAIRLGAVTGLGEWLTDDDPARVLTARLALQHVADTDIPRVAAPARAFLAPDAPAGPTAPRAATRDDRPPTAPGPAETTPAPAPPGHRAHAEETGQTQVARAGRRRLVYATAAAVLLAGTGTAALLLIPHGGNPLGGTGGHPASGALTATSPWRLVVDDNIDDDDHGCDVTVTNTATGEKTKLDTFYGTRSFQMQKTATFRWDANDEGCRVIQRPGPGAARLPFSAHAYTGDTDAFAAPKAPDKIRVTIPKSDDTGDCDFELRSATDGQILDFGLVSHGGGSRLLDPHSATQVYLAHVECDAHIAAARN